MLKNSKGFSMVDMTITLAILGILCALAIPSYQRSQTLARRTEVIMILDTFALAETTHIIENDKYTANEATLVQYGLLPLAQAKFYQTRVIMTDVQETSGYFIFLMGNIDSDDTLDAVAFKYGTNLAPQYQQGMTIVIDDSKV